MSKKQMAVIGGIVTTLVVVIVAGVIFLTQGAQANPVNATETMESSIDLFSDFKSYRFDMDMDMTMTIDMSGLGAGKQTMDTNTTATGAIVTTDSGNYIMQMNQVVNVPAANTTVNADYIVDLESGFLYIDVNSDPKKYSLDNLDELAGTPYAGFTSIESMLDQQFLSQLEEGATYEYIAQEEIDSISTYKYSVQIDSATYMGQIDEQIDEMVTSFNQLGLNVTKDDISMQIGDVESYIWIAKDTNAPVKQYACMNNTSIKISDLLELSIDDMCVNMTFSDFNSEISIDIPQI